MAFSPNGKTVVTGSWDNTARLWEAATGKPIGLALQHQGQVLAVAFSPDVPKTVLTGSAMTRRRGCDACLGELAVIRNRSFSGPR